MVAANPNAYTTVVLQSNIGGNSVVPREVYYHSGSRRLTIDGAGFTINDLGLQPQQSPYSNICLLLLKDVIVSNMWITEALVAKTSALFGIVQHSGTVDVASFTTGVPGNPTPPDRDDKSPMFEGTKPDRDPSADATAFSAAVAGVKGESISETGETGFTGFDGAGAWTVILDYGADWVATSYLAVNQDAQPGGKGGKGAGTGGAKAGRGGDGGKGYNDGMGTPSDGATAGDGGDLTMTAGDGGRGGAGGDAGSLTIPAAFTLGIYSKTGGDAGLGGAKGTIAYVASDPGTPGTAENGGNPGNFGNAGSVSATDGTDGALGDEGTDGSLTLS